MINTVNNVLNLRIQQRFDPAAKWEVNNPVLLRGEVAFDEVGYKIGDGTSTWTQLNYILNSEEISSELADAIALLKKDLEKQSDSASELKTSLYGNLAKDVDGNDIVPDSLEDISVLEDGILPDIKKEFASVEKDAEDTKEALFGTTTTQDTEGNDVVTVNEPVSTLDEVVATDGIFADIKKKIEEASTDEDLDLVKGSLFGTTTQTVDGKEVITPNDAPASFNAIDTTTDTGLFAEVKKELEKADSEVSTLETIMLGKAVEYDADGTVTFPEKLEDITTGIIADVVKKSDDRDDAIETVLFGDTLANLKDENKDAIIVSSILPGYVDDIVPVTITGEVSKETGLFVIDTITIADDKQIVAGVTVTDKNKIYLDVDTQRTFRYAGEVEGKATYAEISSSLALGETASTAFRGDFGLALKKAVFGKTDTDTGEVKVDVTSAYDYTKGSVEERLNAIEAITTIYCGNAGSKEAAASTVILDNGTVDEVKESLAEVFAVADIADQADKIIVNTEGDDITGITLKGVETTENVVLTSDIPFSGADSSLTAKSILVEYQA